MSGNADYKETGKNGWYHYFLKVKKGVGTTFVIRVPFKIDPDADKREERRMYPKKIYKGLHILLAEDNGS